MLNRRQQSKQRKNRLSVYFCCLLFCVFVVNSLGGFREIDQPRGMQQNFQRGD
jgi:hypothetical protein